jgi:hypothetical protein
MTSFSVANMDQFVNKPLVFLFKFVTTGGLQSRGKNYPNHAKYGFLRHWNCLQAWETEGKIRNILDSKKITLKTLQLIIGLLIFACRVVAPFW